MTLDNLCSFFAWCTLVNFLLLLYWSVMILFCKDFVYKMHSKFFNIDKQDFIKIHYLMIAYFKLTVFIFNLVPWIAIAIISR